MVKPLWHAPLQTPEPRKVKQAPGYAHAGRGGYGSPPEHVHASAMALRPHLGSSLMVLKRLR